MVSVDKDIKNIQNVNQFFKSFLPIDPLTILFSHPDAGLDFLCRTAGSLYRGHAGSLSSKPEGGVEESG